MPGLAWVPQPVDYVLSLAASQLTPLDSTPRRVSRRLGYCRLGYAVAAMSDSPYHRLLDNLRERRLVLLVGAGASRDLDYPLLDQLVADMHEGLLGRPAPFPFPVASDLADMIRSELRTAKREDDYYGFLSKTFQPRDKTFDTFHSELVRLPIRGLVTTNYDVALEHAVLAANNGSPPCETLDLCSHAAYWVFEYLRTLGTAPHIGDVLHLHGYYKASKHLILTSSDFHDKYYGTFRTSSGQQLDVRLETLHRKVLWALLVTYPVLFVGFSMRDEVFRDLLRVIKYEFERGQDLGHFALIGSVDDIEDVRTRVELSDLGISAVTYRIQQPVGLPPDHSALLGLVQRLSRDLGLPPFPPSLSSFTEEMLNL